MTQLNRKVVLDTLIRHETLFVDDIAKEENLGFAPDKQQLHYLLDELTESQHLKVLDGVTPLTYPIREKGIEEGKRLNEEGNN